MITRTVRDNELVIVEDGQEILSVKEEIDEEKIMLYISGEMKKNAIHNIEDELTTLTTLKRPIIIDLSKVTYMSGSSTDIFLQIQKSIDLKKNDNIHCKEYLKILNPSKEVSEVFEKNGFFDLLDIEM